MPFSNHHGAVQQFMNFRRLLPRQLLHIAVQREHIERLHPLHGPFRRHARPAHAEVQVVGIRRAASRRKGVKVLLHHVRRIGAQILQCLRRQHALPAAPRDLVDGRPGQVPGPRQSGVAVVPLPQPAGERLARVARVRVVKHARGWQFRRKTPGGFIHQEITDEGRVVLRLPQNRGVIASIIREAGMFDVREIAIDHRRLLPPEAHRANVRELRLRCDLPGGPVRHRVAAQPPEFGQRDRGPVLAPFRGTESSNEVCGEVVDETRARTVCDRLGVDFLELAGGIWLEAERVFNSVDAGFAIHTDTIRPVGEERVAVRVHQPPAFAVVMSAEETSGLGQLSVTPSAPPAEGPGPTLAGGLSQLALQAAREFLDVPRSRGPRMQITLAHLVYQRTLRQEDLVELRDLRYRGAQRRHAPAHGVPVGTDHRQRGSIHQLQIHAIAASEGLQESAFAVHLPAVLIGDLERHAHAE